MSSLGIRSGATTLARSSSKSKTKSRNGCITCKLKRLKCDELKPYCLNCTKKNIKCGGYATRFKWRSFNDGKEPHHDLQSATTFVLNSTDETTSSISLPHVPKQHIVHEPSRLTTLVKSEPSEDVRALLLKQHLELASLSVVGKSTRDIKFDNELLAKGINPDTYDDAKSAKRMRRSFSYTDARSSTTASMHRSYSTSTCNTLEVQSFRDEVRKSGGLESLAEAAVDEMKSKSPIALSHSPMHFEPDSLSLSHFHQEKTPKLVGSVPTPREWTFNGNLPNSSEIPTPHARDTMSDLNLTPSLTALINYVFTNDDVNKGADPGAMKLGGLSEAPLSPLDLTVNGGNNLDMAMSPPFHNRRGSILKHLGHQDSPGAIVRSSNRSSFSPDKLLMEVGDQLSQYEPLSPSIASTSSLQSLLRSSENEQILFLFSTYTCGIMSIKAGVAENPWRNVILPLATNYSYLFNSIASMTLFHLAGNSKLGDKSAGLRSKGYFYMKKCIIELASGLTKMDNNIVCENQLPADIALATCLNLAVSESWDTQTSSGIAHLKGAKSMIHKVISLIKQHASNVVSRAQLKDGDHRPTDDVKKKLVLVTDEEWRRIEEAAIEPASNSGAGISSVFVPRNLQILFNAWIYFEVLSQMTSYTFHDDKGIDLVATITKIIHQTQKKRDEDSSKGSKHSEQSESPNSDSHELNAIANHPFGLFENFESIFSNNDYIDPLLGCAQSLFLIMGRVANLISKVCDKRTDKRPVRTSLANISTASELRKQLLDWKPNITPPMDDINSEGQSPNSTWDTYSCVSTAEAYRYATLLYLHQAVPELPSLTSHQLAEKILVLLASIPTDSNLHIIHIFPLLVSSCEANPGEEREWCVQRWSLLIDRIWIGNIDRALEVVKEVWRRKDEHTRKMRRDLDDSTFANKMDLEDTSSVSFNVPGLGTSDSADSQKGIGSRLHWSSVMREWGWEVLLA